MIYKVTITFELDSDEYRDIRSKSDAKEAVADMLNDYVDWPDGIDIVVEPQE